MEKILPLVNWFKRWGFCGLLRFRMLHFAHRLIGDGLAEQWDFAKKHIRGIWALDVGATYSLFVYALNKHFGRVNAVDLRPYQERLPYNINFVPKNIFHVRYSELDYISLISVIQFIKNKKGLFHRIHSFLCAKGVFVLTVPSNKMNFKQLNELAESSNFKIKDYQECKGHISIALIKKGA